MTTLSVICREEGYPNDILIYAVDADPNDEDAVQQAVQKERARDVDDANDMEILFAFAGDIDTVADWRG